MPPMKPHPQRSPPRTPEPKWEEGAKTGDTEASIRSYSAPDDSIDATTAGPDCAFSFLPSPHASPGTRAPSLAAARDRAEKDSFLHLRDEEEDEERGEEGELSGKLRHHQ
ncbi:unnamed protein product [Parajaminaea phylloscopi]